MTADDIIRQIETWEPHYRLPGEETCRDNRGIIGGGYGDHQAVGDAVRRLRFGTNRYGELRRGGQLPPRQCALCGALVVLEVSQSSGRGMLRVRPVE
jgi:hypothetical protein